jgi:ribosomal protein S18 acetylase RimI-like enzyme
MQIYSTVSKGVSIMASKGEVTIRPMERGDIDAIISIYNKIREEKIPGVKRSRLSYRKSMTYEEVALTNPGGPLDLSLVAEADGKAVGFIWSGLAYVGIPVDEVGLIYMLIVDPEYQKKGIAGRLVNALIKRCRDRGVNTVRAVLDEREWELQNYFQKLGFKRSELTIFTRPTQS